jgi:hypothetical protein
VSMDEPERDHGPSFNIRDEPTSGEHPDFADPVSSPRSKGGPADWPGTGAALTNRLLSAGKGPSHLDP